MAAVVSASSWPTGFLFALSGGILRDRLGWRRRLEKGAEGAGDPGRRSCGQARGPGMRRLYGVTLSSIPDVLCAIVYGRIVPSEGADGERRNAGILRHSLAAAFELSGLLRTVES